MLNYFVCILFGIARVEMYRTSMCLRKNEQFSLCGWRCPPSCVNLKLYAAGEIRCPSVWDCRVGCRCDPGYVRDEYSKNCILVQDCPVICLFVTSGLTAPVENVARNNEHPLEGEGSIPVAVLLVVPGQPEFREDNEEVMKLSPESALPLPVSDERAAKNYYEDSYATPAVAYKPEAPAHGGSGAAVATFSASVSPSAIPVLLSCAPKVITGNLVESKPSAYRSVLSDLAEILSPNNAENDFNLSDILGIDSPSSATSFDGDEERKRRSFRVESSAARYKVSEDYPEERKGNHHLVSEDYPQPNMVQLTPSQN